MAFTPRLSHLLSYFISSFHLSKTRFHISLIDNTVTTFSTARWFISEYVLCESLKWSSSDSWSHFNTGSEPMLYILVYNVSVSMYTIIVPTSIKYTLSDVLIVDSNRRLRIDEANSLTFLYLFCLWSACVFLALQ